MKIFAAIVIIAIIVPESVFAKIYKYIDDSGQVNYTNVLSTIPGDKLTNLVEFEEDESKTVPVRPSPDTGITRSQQNQIDSARKSLIRKKYDQQQKLEAEYNMLLREKKALDNNKSFQKRRKKRRYQNRPYIQELIKKEVRLLDRLKELEAELKTSGGQ